MKREFTRKELYELVWRQPMRTVAASAGISDVALAKHCKKANIPVPNRGYWARKQAGKPTIRISLPPRFPGASDRIGGSGSDKYYWGSDWAEKFLEVPVPRVPTFDEAMSSVEERVRKLVVSVRCPRKFEPVHPLVAKLLAHDEKRRQEFIKWRSSYYAPKYDTGRTAAATNHQRPLSRRGTSRVPVVDEHLEIRARRQQRKRPQHHNR